MSNFFGVIQEYNLNNKTRSINELFTSLVKDFPGVLSLFKNGGMVTQKTHQWMERQLAPSSTTIVTGGTGTTLELASVAGLAVGDVLRFEASTGAFIEEQVLITAINTGTSVVTVTRNYEGGSTPVDLAVGTIVEFAPQTPDGALVSEMTEAKYTDATFVTNYLQNISRTYSLTKQAAAAGVYGSDAGAIVSKIMDLEAQANLDIMWQMDKQAIKGVPKEGTASVNSSAGGLYHFIKDGNTHDSGGGAITLDKINDVVAVIRENGVTNPMLVGACHQDQARNISALRSAGTAISVNRVESSTAIGGYVTQIDGDLPNSMVNIIIDNNIPKDQFYVLNPDFLAIKYLLPMTMEDASGSNAEQRITRAINGTFTFEIQNGQQAHGLLSGLNI